MVGRPSSATTDELAAGFVGAGFRSAAHETAHALADCQQLGGVVVEGSKERSILQPKR